MPKKSKTLFDDHGEDAAPAELKVNEEFARRFEVRRVFFPSQHITINHLKIPFYSTIKKEKNSIV